MRQLKLSRSELADRAGISRGYVSDLLNGKRGGRLGAGIMLSLAQALDVEPFFFTQSFAHAKRKRRPGRIGGRTAGEVTSATPE